MKIINLTPHRVAILNDTLDCISIILPSGVVARVSTTIEKRGYLQINDTRCGRMGKTYPVEIVKSKTGPTITGLPDEEEGTYFLVSRMVRDAVPDERMDLLVPDDLVRDEQGNIIGCRRLSL